MTGPAAGKFSLELFEHLGYLVVNVFAAVVSVKAQDLERELREYLLDDRQQVRLEDRLRSGHHLPLRDAIHRVDVGQPLDAVVVALVNSVNDTGATVVHGSLANADVHSPDRPSLGQRDTLCVVKRAVAQVVQVPH